MVAYAINSKDEKYMQSGSSVSKRVTMHTVYECYVTCINT